MARPATAIRAAVQARHPGATVQARGRNWIAHRAPDGTRVLDVSLGPLHRADDQTEIDTDWQPDAGAWQWQMTGADYTAHARSVLNAGGLMEYRAGEAWVTFDPQSLNWVNEANSRQQIAIKQPVTAAVVDGDVLRWVNGYGTGRHYQLQTQSARLQKLVTIDALANLPAATVTGTVWLEQEFTLSHAAGLTVWLDGVQWLKVNNQRVRTAGRVEFRDASGTPVWWLDLPRAFDSAGNQTVGQYEVRRQGGASNLFVTVRIPKVWVDAAVFPIFLDPTIDVSVAAGDDDADELANGNVVTAGNPLVNVDGTGEWNAWRFQGITIPAGATVTVAYLTVQMTSASLDEPDVTFYGLDTTTPAVFVAGSATFTVSSRARTTASVDWANANAGTGDVNTSDLSTIIQELVDSYAPYSSGVLGLAMTSRANDLTRDTSITSYDGSTSVCARLHIEYTEAGAAFIARSGLLIQQAVNRASTY
jgi:hypothetical protein